MKKKIIALSLIMVLLAMNLTGCDKSQQYVGEVHVLTFPDYFDPDLMYRFEDQTGIMVVADTCETNDELNEKVESDEDCDLVCISDYVASKYIDNDTLKPINYNNVPNVVYVDRENFDLISSIDEDNKYAVPHTSGTYGILYNKSMIKKGEITGWKDLWNPEYKGQIMMTDNMRDLMMVALKMRGYSENTTDPDAIAQAGEDLAKLKPSITTSTNSGIKNALIKGEAAIGVVPSGEVVDAVNCNANLDYVIPEEGTEVWNDCWVICKKSKNSEYAERFLNYMLNPESAYQNQQYLSYGTPNIGMYLKLTPTYLRNEAMFPSYDTLKKCEVLVNLDDETTKLYEQAWKKYKDA